MSPRSALGTTRYVDSSALRGLCAAWEDVKQARLAAMQREQDWLADALHPVEDKLSRQVVKALHAHVIWPWLSQYPGLGGAHTARLIAIIEDPHRFPGRRCTAGHYLPVVAEGRPEIEASDGVGGPCPSETMDGPCTGTLLPPRPGTGVRSLWHFCGLHVVNGRSPRKTKGQRADWNPAARTAVLQPGGIAEQIVRQRVPVYRDIYDATKDRLIRERGAEQDGATDAESGPALPDGPEVDTSTEVVISHGLRPIQIDNIARKVAAKAFLGDLLIAWKAIASEPERAAA